MLAKRFIFTSQREDEMRGGFLHDNIARWAIVGWSEEFDLKSLKGSAKIRPKVPERKKAISRNDHHFRKSIHSSCS